MDSGRSLEAVVRHAAGLEDEENIWPVVMALAASCDTGLIPRLREALDQFLDDGNWYGRELIAPILAGIQLRRGCCTLPLHLPG